MRRWLIRTLQEPFVHFVLLGVVMFAAGQHFDQSARTAQITITQQQIRLISDNYRQQYGQHPAPEQLDALVEHFIEEEISYREALKLGLDTDDEIIRRRLVQKYSFLQQDLAIPAEPTEAQLLDYYRRYSDGYRRAQTVTFSHVYFAPDVRRDEDEVRRAARTLASSLNNERLSSAPRRGDPFPGDNDFIAATREDLRRVFGNGAFVENLFNIEPGRWIGPLRSGLGWHLVYVTRCNPSEPIPFSEVHNEVRRDYLETERERLNTQSFAEVRKSFHIVRE